MTLEEAIEKERAIADFRRSMYAICSLKERNTHFLDEAEEHEQMAEWLEELKNSNAGYKEALEDVKEMIRLNPKRLSTPMIMYQVIADIDCLSSKKGIHGRPFWYKQGRKDILGYIKATRAKQDENGKTVYVISEDLMEGLIGATDEL